MKRLALALIFLLALSAPAWSQDGDRQVSLADKLDALNKSLDSTLEALGVVLDAAVDEAAVKASDALDKAADATSDALGKASDALAKAKEQIEKGQAPPAAREFEATVLRVVDGDKGGFVSETNSAASGFWPGSAFTSATDAATMQDDARVVLRGHIVRNLGKDKYLFKDDSGSIQVGIDDDKWQGQTVTPDDTVELHGEIDKGRNSVEVEVNRVVKLR